MSTIREFKEDLQFNTGLIELLEIMKNTAVFQFRALQARKERFDLFFNTVESFFSFMGRKTYVNKLINPASKREAILIVTSDEGFVGGINSQVVNEAFLHPGAPMAEIAVVGERGARYLKDTRKSFVPFKGAAAARDRRILAAALTDYILTGVKEGRFGRVTAAYPKPISFMLQKVEIVTILPIFPESPTCDTPKDRRQLIVESPLDEIIYYLAEELITEKLFCILEDSKLSEFAARAIHLEGSSQDLAEKNKKVRLQYFKAYHEIIDKSTRELFAAQVTIHKKD